MIPWADVYMRGARRLADPGTYVILLVGVLLSIVCTALPIIIWLGNPRFGTFLASSLIGVLLSWLNACFVLGALHVAAASPAGRVRPVAVLRTTADKFGAFLGVTAILFGCTVLVVLAMLVPALLGFGGTSFAPVLAVLTPMFQIIGGVGVVLLVLVARLAFASVALESSSAGLAVRRGMFLARRQTSEVVLWLAGDTALSVGVFLAVLVPVLLGGALGSGIQGSFLGFDLVPNFLSGPGSGGGAVLGAVIFWSFSSAFAVIATGMLSAFGAGSAVGFSDAMISQARSPRSTPAPPEPFCDQCGALRRAGSAYCDTCGSMLVLA